MATGRVGLAADAGRPLWAPGPIANATSSSNFDFQIGVQPFPRSRKDFQISTKVRGSFMGTKCLDKGNTKSLPLSCGARAFFIQSSYLPITPGLAGDIRWGPTFLSESLQIFSGRRRRRVFSLATAGNEPSANTNDLSLNEGNTNKGAATSSSAASFWPPWNSRPYQTDWNSLIFNWRKDEPLWTVPWTGQTIFQVMVLWFAAFWVVGSWVLPVAAQVAGFSRHSLTFRGQALYSLITDIAEGTVGIWILKRCLSRFFPLPDGWFPMKLRGKWLLEACWGCLFFPFVTKLSQLNLYLFPFPNLNASFVEQSVMSRDLVATFLYAIVISVCAPVWEEVIFRGFLLPSMTRYMPLWGAVVVSALAFALAHFSLQRILPLTFLGLVMGFVFVRSKNLLASIVLHSLWNGFAFLELL